MCCAGSYSVWWLAAVAGHEREREQIMRDMQSGYPVDTVQAGRLVGRLVAESDRYFDWYSGETVSELAVQDQDGREVRLAVSDRDRRVIRAGYVGQFYGSVNLYNVSGLVRRFYGAATFGHSEWFVDQLTTCYGDWSAAVPVGDLI